jgi:hypothetical protein
MQYNEFSIDVELEEYRGVSKTENYSDSDDESDDDSYYSASELDPGKQEEIEKSNKVKSKFDEYSKFKHSLDALQDEFALYEDGDDNWAATVEERLKYFTPFLTDLGKVWTQSADKRPRLIAAVDIHAERWKKCEHGKLSRDFSIT